MGLGPAVFLPCSPNLHSTEGGFLLPGKLLRHPDPGRFLTVGLPSLCSVQNLVIGLTSCFLCILVPPGWVLSHLESYKKRE